MGKTYEKLNECIIKHVCLIILFAFLFMLIFIKSAYEKQEIASYNSMDNGDFARPMKMMSVSGFAAESRTADTFASDRKIVQNSSLEIEVKNVEQTKKGVEQQIKQVGGYIDNFNSYTYYNDQNIAYNFVIRVPSEKLRDSILSLKKLGTLKSESFSASDITEAYEDTDNQLKNLMTRRDRLRKLMETNTKNVKDILEVDRELTSVQSTIEIMTRLQNQRNKDVSYSVLNLTLIPEVQITDLNGSDWKFTSSWKNAVNSLIKFGQKSMDYINLTIVFAPILFVTLILVYIFIKITKRRK